MIRKTVRAGAALLAAGAATSLTAAGAAGQGARGLAVVLGLVSFLSTILGAVAVLFGWVLGRAEKSAADET